MYSETARRGRQPQQGGAHGSCRRRSACSWAHRWAGRHACGARACYPWHCPRGRTAVMWTSSCTGCTGGTSRCSQPNTRAPARGSRGRATPSSRGPGAGHQGRIPVAGPERSPAAAAGGNGNATPPRRPAGAGVGDGVRPGPGPLGSGPPMAGRPKGRHLGRAGPAGGPPTISCGGCASRSGSARKSCGKPRGCCSATWRQGASCKGLPVTAAEHSFRSGAACVGGCGRGRSSWLGRTWHCSCKAWPCICTKHGCSACARQPASGRGGGATRFLVTYFPRPPGGWPALLPYALRPRREHVPRARVEEQRPRREGEGRGSVGARCAQRGSPSCRRCVQLGWGISWCCRAGHEGHRAPWQAPPSSDGHQAGRC